MADATMLDDFVALSETLTGVQPLDRTLAQQYLDRCLTNANIAGWLPQLIATFKDIVAKTSGDGAIKTRIMNDANLGAVAEQIIYLWYVSAFFLKDAPGGATGKWQYGSSEQYDAALMWPIIGTDPPMSTQHQDYGFWGKPILSSK